MENLILQTIGADNDNLEVLRPRVFGILADIAWPVVNNYRSDLYHDAMWLNDYLSLNSYFYFSVDNSGTSIGTDDTLIALRCNSINARMFTVWLVRVKSMRSSVIFWELQLQEFSAEEISNLKLQCHD